MQTPKRHKQNLSHDSSLRHLLQSHDSSLRYLLQSEDDDNYSHFNNNNNIQSAHSTTQQKQQQQSPSLMEQGLSLFGFPTNTSSSMSNNPTSPSKKSRMNMNKSKSLTPNGRGRQRFTAQNNNKGNNNQNNRRKRFSSHERSSSSMSSSTNASSPISPDQLQFLSCDDASLVLSDERNQRIAEGMNQNEEEIMSTTPTTLSSSSSSITTGVGGSAEVPPGNQSNGGRKIRRRKLNWRVGPLQKIRKPKIRTYNSSGSSSNGSISDGVSVAERTVKSFHTFHSTETVKVGNNNQGPTNNKRNGIPSHPQQQNQQQQKYANASLPLPSSTYSSPQTTLNGKKVIAESFHHYEYSSTATPSTVASTPGASVTDDDGIHEDDDGTVIESLEESTQMEESNRTIRLFGSSSSSSSRSDKESQRSKRDLSPSPSTNSNTTNGNRPPLGNPPKSVRVQSMKRVGLPPRSPFVASKLNYDQMTFSNSTDNNNNDATKFTSDDESESNESGGPLWQLAKLHAISEGPIPSSPQSQPPHSNYSTTSSPPQQGGRKYVTLSSNGSVCTNHTSSTDPEDIQMRQAERNLKAIHSLAQQHLKFGEIPEAITVLQEMLRGVKELHGEDHYRVGTVLHNISTVYIRAGLYRKAIHSCRQAVDVRRKSLGAFHSDLAASLTTLGIAYLEMNQYEDAILNFKRAMIIRRKTLSYNDPKIARLLNNIGCAFYDSGNLDEAERSFEEALSIQKMLMHGSKISCDEGGDTSVNSDNVLLGIASTLCNLGSIRARWKKYDEAIASLEEALLLQQSILGDDHPKVINTKDSIDLIIQSRSHTNSMVSLTHFQLDFGQYLNH